MKALYIAACHLIKGGTYSSREYSPITEIKGKQMYRNGVYSIYEHIKGKAYYFLWKNVIVGEYTGVNSELAELLIAGTEPTAYPQKYNYGSVLAEIKEAPMWAEKYNFEIKDI